MQKECNGSTLYVSAPCQAELNLTRLDQAELGRAAAEIFTAAFWLAGAGGLTGGVCGGAGDQSGIRTFAGISTDSYFTLEEAEIECGRLARGEWRPLTSLFGHCAGALGRLPAESAFICRAMADLLLA